VRPIAFVPDDNGQLAIAKATKGSPGPTRQEDFVDALGEAANA
jgi:hypothetical protein